MISSPSPVVNPRERGMALLATLAAVFAIGLFAATVTTMIADTGETKQVQVVGNQAFYMAESGARYAIHRFRTEGADAFEELNGGSFALGNGWGFEVKVDMMDNGSTLTFDIDAVGVSGGAVSDGGVVDPQATGQRQSLNGYNVEVPVVTNIEVDVPVGFNYAIQSLSTSQLRMTGSAYIDSYDSSEGDWTAPGALQDAWIRSAGIVNVLELTGSARVYGSVSVPSGVDLENYAGIVDVPIGYGEDECPPVFARNVFVATAIPPPEEPEEVAKPTAWDSLPKFAGKVKGKSQSQTIAGGAYSTSSDFDPGTTAVTVSDSLSLDVGDDFTLTGGGSLQVDGSMGAWIADDVKITGSGSGLAIHGDADFLVGGDFEISSSQSIVIDGSLDLDVAGGLKITGTGSLHVKGDAYIDVAGAFDIEGGGSLIIDGSTIVKVGEDLKFSGHHYPVVVGEDGWVEIYVAAGSITINASQIDTHYAPAQFMVFGSDEVESVRIAGNGRVIGTFHAPAAEFSMNGTSELFGAVLAWSATQMVGNACIHYDKELGRAWPTSDLPDEQLRRYWTVVGEVD